MTTRRGFIAGLLAATATPSLTWADAGNPAYISAARLQDGSYALFGLSAKGDDLFQIPLPDRGHAATVHPSQPQAVAFARRPGRFALVIDCVGGKVIRKLDAPDGRHFYGHGVFAQEGTVLCTTENDVETGNGVIGFWSVPDGYQRMGEIPSGGIGPHEILVMKDQKTLVVANGGIRTHPDTGRQKLNLGEMHSNLHLVEISGNQVGNYQLPIALQKNSIRHLAIDQNDKIAFGMQWQGDNSDIVAMFGVWKKGKEVVLPVVDFSEQVQLKNYVASVAINGGKIGITSSVGGIVQIYDQNNKLLQSHRRRDVSGIAKHLDGFIYTDGNGGVLGFDGEQSQLIRRTDRAWDNHLVALS